MHQLAAPPIVESGQAVDLGQSPGDIAFLSAADTDLVCLAAAQARLTPAAPSLRVANLLRLSHPFSVDLHIDATLARAKLVVIRLLGGVGYWRYGVERLVALAPESDLKLAFLPGDDKPDPELVRLSNLPPRDVDLLWRCLLAGGVENAERFLVNAAALIAGQPERAEPIAPPRCALLAAPEIDGPAVPILFYRALAMAGNLEPIETLTRALAVRGLRPLPIYLPGLKDAGAIAFLTEAFSKHPPAVILNATGFAVGAGGDALDHPVSRADCPVLQVAFAGTTEADWRDGARGLGPRDIAMSVALPELDGRIFGRAVAFKQTEGRDPLTEGDLLRTLPIPDRIEFAADQAASWARLRKTEPTERRIALILGNYPNRDGRIGNGVGLDTPESVAAIGRAMIEAGYDLGADFPQDGTSLMARVTSGATNQIKGRRARRVALTWPLDSYRRAFKRLPAALQADVIARWGEIEKDPHVANGGFTLSGFRSGKAVVMVQPARGYDLDPAETWHDPALVPPHFYLATYFWLRDAEGFDAHALIHVGKHGTLEWLPGKGVALSQNCWPEATLGSLPALYPFIINDPGEGTQAKRRSSAVIVDHLIPPLRRGGGDAGLAELERLIDEWHQARQMDPRRCAPLQQDILDRAARSGLAQDAGLDPTLPIEEALRRLDGFVCTVKELQIRDGLHVFGRGPDRERADPLLAALARTPRGADPADDSLIRALAKDLELDFDPLTADPAEPWRGPRPAVLIGESRWRTQGDAVERLEQLALKLVSRAATPEESWFRSIAVLERLEARWRPALAACGPAELRGLLLGLDGRRVPPGPSGAPTRGRPDLLPTGCNFYSVDGRMLPTQAAWALGWRSAQELVERHAQQTGAWPKSLALSAWGTATMRTGGDDVAQALALMGVRPVWEVGSGRVIDLEILPAGVLDRPRVDVTFRVSGFFRDAFPGLIALVDRAAQAIAALDEPASVNPAASNPGPRVFGPAPGAYGAGLQALIDSGAWADLGDLAEGYLAWSSFSYQGDGDGGTAEGKPARAAFETALSRADGVVHNQDNREHDLLDSDDYYQFEGGLAAAITHLTGSRPVIWHNDHSLPEHPRIQRLETEIARVVRGRAANPNWIKGCMRHGYKGAAEMAATVDYLFAFAATTGAVTDHHFDMLAESYLADPAVSAFLEQANPAALVEMTARFREAVERKLWRPRSNRLSTLLHDLTEDAA